MLVHQIKVELHCRQAHDLSKILFYETNPCHGGENALEVYGVDNGVDHGGGGGGGRKVGGEGCGRPVGGAGCA